MITEHDAFDAESIREAAAMAKDLVLAEKAMAWRLAALPYKYTYHFKWLGRPIIQHPVDVIVMQEIIWRVRPDLIIETGVAHGGSLVFSASMLALLDLADAESTDTAPSAARPPRQVVGIDVDIRPHNRAALESHPLASRIRVIQGSSTDASIVSQVRDVAESHRTVLVCLDSNHTHEHVLAELHAYASLVTPGSYCVVFDTIIDDLPADAFPNRPWGLGNNPKTAVREFLASHPEFVVDTDVEDKLVFSVAPEGYLRRVP